MGRYHINPQTGIVGRCKAKIQCKFGGQHFTTKEEAYQFLGKPTPLVIPHTIGKKIPNNNNRKSADVSLNEKFVVQGIVNHNLEKAAENIAALDNDKRTTAFRNLNKEQIKSALTRLDAVLRSITSNDEVFSDPIGNKNGQDLIGTKTGKMIELKIGYGITDGAIGFGTAKKLLPDTISALLPTSEDRLKRYEMYAAGDKEGAHKNWVNQINMLKTELNNVELTKDNMKALDLYVAGVNKESDLDKALVDGFQNNNGYDIVIVDRPNADGIPEWKVKHTRGYDNTHNWKIDISRGDNSENRFNIFLVRDDGVQVKMTLNQKNSAKVVMKNGDVEKTYNEYGIGSPSFNVWISDNNR